MATLPSPEPRSRVEADAAPQPVARRFDARSAWIRAGIAVGLATVALVALFWDTTTSAVNVWIGSKTYNHCFLILPIVAYLLWDRRRLFAEVAPRPFWWGLLLFPVIGAIWLVAEAASLREGQHIAFALLLEATLLTVLGWRAFWAFLFPFLYLLFLVPTGEFLVPRLQDFTADFSVLLLRLIGVPTFRDGVFITIPNGYFEVAEACAGIRFLIASIAFGFLFANVVYRNWARRALFIALSVVVPVIANGFRAFGIIMLAHMSNNTIAVGADHLIYGWFFFALIMLLLIWIGGRLRGPEDDGEVEAPAIARGGPAGSRGALAGAAVLAALAAGAAPAAAAWLHARPTDVDLSLVAAPPPPPGWRLAESTSGWEPKFPNADKVVRQTYASPEGEEVELFIAYYDRQRSDAKVLAQFNELYDGEEWARAGGFDATAPIDGPVPAAGVRMISRYRTTRVLLSWFWVDGQFTASGIEAKLLQARAELATRRRAAAAVALAANYVENPDEAVRRIDAFLKAAEPLGEILNQASKR